MSFNFFSDPAAGFCAGTAVGKGSVAIVGTAPGIAHPSQSSGALGAGQFAFQASLASDANYTVNNQTGTVAGDCEPFTVNPAPTGTVTVLHNGPGNDSFTTPLILAENTSAATDTVHDSAQPTGQVGSIAITGNVTFRFYATAAACVGDANFAGGTQLKTIALVAGAAHPSTAATGLTAGYYGFRARYNGDTNYTASVSACEPFYVTTLKITKFIHGPSATFSYDVTGRTPERRNDAVDEHHASD